MVSLLTIHRKKKCDQRPTGKRKRLFKAALAYYGITREDWVRGQDNLSLYYFEGVFHGVKKSPRVEGLIEGAIDEFLDAAFTIRQERQVQRVA